MNRTDHYQPKGRLECPICHVTLTEWLGNDGPCRFLLWREGTAEPVDQIGHALTKIAIEIRKELRLSNSFQIFSYDCDAHCVMAECSAPEGTWIDTRISSVTDIMSILEVKESAGDTEDTSVPPLNINELIIRLKRDACHHEGLEEPLKEAQILEFVERSGFNVPPSFSTFLKDFCSGAYWLYESQPVDSTKNPEWLHKHHKKVPELIPMDDGSLVPMNSLFCLVSEDSNGGAWCWLTSLPNEQGEFPLAYFIGSALHYKVESFAHWLRALVEYEGEVIRALDKEGKLGLG